MALKNINLQNKLTSLYYFHQKIGYKNIVMLDTPEQNTKRNLIFFLIIGGIFLFVTILGSNYVLSTGRKSSNIGDLIPGLNPTDGLQSSIKIANASQPPVLTKNDVDLPIKCEPIKVDQGNLISCKGTFNIKVDNAILPEKGVKIKLVKYEENSSKKPRIESSEFYCVLHSDQNSLLCDLRPDNIYSGQYFVDLTFGEESILNVVQDLITIN
ncbi:MAG: hypothetical protein WCK98_03880 [bacterium]